LPFNITCCFVSVIVGVTGLSLTRTIIGAGKCNLKGEQCALTG